MQYDSVAGTTVVVPARNVSKIFVVKWYSKFICLSWDTNELYLRQCRKISYTVRKEKFEAMRKKGYAVKS